jgi:hypothetical protein
MPVGGCRCLFRKKHQGNSCKREEQEENNAPFAQTTQEIRAIATAATAAAYPRSLKEMLQVMLCYTDRFSRLSSRKMNKQSKKGKS